MEEVIEIFGKRLKIVKDKSNSANYCEMCAVKDICYNVVGNGRIPFCEDAKGKMNRHFELVND